MQTKTNKETETKTKYRQQLLRGSNVMALRTFALVQTQCVNFQFLVLQLVLMVFVVRHPGSL